MLIKFIIADLIAALSIHAMVKQIQKRMEVAEAAKK